MISKHYSAFCEHCTDTTELTGRTFKEAESDLISIGWKKVKGKWYCENCLNENERSQLHGIEV